MGTGTRTATILRGARARGGRMQQRRGRLRRRRERQRRQSLTVWTIEDVADRVTAQKKMAQEFTQKTGIKVNVVAVAEDQFDQTITSAAAADTLPDVVAALPLSALRTLESGDLLDTETAKQVVDDLGADTFAAAQPRAHQGRRQAARRAQRRLGASCWSTGGTCSTRPGWTRRRRTTRSRRPRRR